MFFSVIYPVFIRQYAAYSCSNIFASDNFDFQKIVSSNEGNRSA